MKHTDYISRTEAAELLGVDKQTISNYIDKGVISWKQIGKMKYVLRSDIEAMKEKILEYKANCDTINALIREQKVEMARMEADFKSKRAAMEDASGMMDVFLNLVREVMLTHNDCLNEREKRVVNIMCLQRAHFGINIMDVADEFFLSRERVRQITNKILRKIEERISEREKDFKALQAHCDELEAKIDATRAIGKKAERSGLTCSEFSRDIYKKKVVDCELSVRALNCLKAADIDTVGDLVMHSKTDLLKYRNFGRKSLSELDDFVESLGLRFGMEIDEVVDNLRYTNAPDEIYLVTGVTQKSGEVDFKELSEVTWADMRVFDNDIAYRRIK